VPVNAENGTPRRSTAEAMIIEHEQRPNSRSVRVICALDR
jgi:hypothetical protein